MAQTRSTKNIKFKVTPPRSKIKCKKNAYRCAWELIRSSSITSTDQIQQNLQMTLTYTFNFCSQHQGQRSNIKTDPPMHTYGIRQNCMPNIKLLLFIVPEIWARQFFCSEGHWAKVKGQMCKITSLCITACHDDVTHQV